jgi:hypothetical protein
MLTADTIAKNSNTRATTPRLIWIDQVIALAGVQVEEMERFCSRRRINRWFLAGEPVWMAADSLRLMVVNGKREERADRETNYLAGKLKVEL